MSFTSRAAPRAAFHLSVRFVPPVGIAMEKTGYRRNIDFLFERILSCRVHRGAIGKNNPGAKRRAGSRV